MSLLSALTAMLMKGQVASLLMGLGIFSAGLGALAVVIKWVLPSVPVLIVIFIGLGAFTLAAWIAIDRLDARKKRRELDLLLAKVQSNTGMESKNDY